MAAELVVEAVAPAVDTASVASAAAAASAAVAAAVVAMFGAADSAASAVVVAATVAGGLQNEHGHRAGSASTVTIATADGVLRGISTPDFLLFNGVQYGETPARFSTALPTPAWTGVVDAITPGAGCPPVLRRTVQPLKIACF